jgi:hypothetical protein
LKFDEIIRNFGFKENEEDDCIYAKFENGKFIFLILYVDDILHSSSDINLLLETKRFLSSNFDINTTGKCHSFVSIFKFISTDEYIQIIFIGPETNKYKVIFVSLGQPPMNIWAISLTLTDPIYSSVEPRHRRIYVA